jgi:hypothetical protein
VFGVASYGSFKKRVTGISDMCTSLLTAGGGFLCFYRVNAARFEQQTLLDTRT